MRKSKYFIPVILFGIVLIAAILRLWQLGSVPISLNWDEVSWGYNALSFVETGRDEFGKRLPIVIRSLEDYKPALYMYLISPFIFLFGLSDFFVRLPNAIAGVLAVLVTYFLVKELFVGRKDIAIISAFLLAVSPWAIQFSRFAHEGMTGLLFNLLMILFFLKSFNKPYFLLLSSLFAALSIYTYQGEKVFVLLMLIILIISFHKEFFKISKKYLASSFVLGLVLVLPMIFFIYSTPESLSRASGASFLNDPVRVLNLRNYPVRGIDNIERNDLAGKIIDNRRIVYARAVTGNYLMHFDPNFLFVNGDVDIGRHQPPRMGHLYLVELPFFLFGLYFLVFGKFRRSVKLFIFLWMLITPAAAAFTWDVPNSGRTINFLPTFQIITAIGILSFYLWLMKLKIKNIFKYSVLGIIGAVALFNFVFYLNQYFVQFNYAKSEDWQYGYSELVPFVDSVSGDYDKIFVSSNRPLDQSYIFFLYNLRYSPSEYQKNPNKNFSNYEFIDTKNFDFSKLKKNEMIVVPANHYNGEYPEDIMLTVDYLNNDNAIIVIKGSGLLDSLEDEARK